MAHARRKFDELIATSEVAREAIERIGWIYHVEGQLTGMPAQQRQGARDELLRPLWAELHIWLTLERGRVPEGSSIAKAIDYSLNGWASLTRHLEDGAVPIDNNFIERQVKPWAMGDGQKYGELLFYAKSARQVVPGGASRLRFVDLSTCWT